MAMTVGELKTAVGELRTAIGSLGGLTKHMDDLTKKMDANTASQDQLGRAVTDLKIVVSELKGVYPVLIDNAFMKAEGQRITDKAEIQVNLAKAQATIEGNQTTATSELTNAKAEIEVKLTKALAALFVFGILAAAPDSPVGRLAGQMMSLALK